MARPSSAAAGGETYIPIPDEDEDQLQWRAGAVAKLEKRLNLLGHLAASMEWVGNATGAVLSLWASSVVLAQLSLESVDKWFAIVMVFMQAIRMYCRSNKLEQLFGCMEAIRWKGSYFGCMLQQPQEWNEVVATIGLSVTIKDFLPIIHLSPLEQITTVMLMTYMVKVQSPGPPKPMSRLLLQAVLIAIVLVEVVEVTSIIVTWKYLPFPEDYLFLEIPHPVALVLAALLLYMRPSAITNLTNSPRGRKLLYTAKAIFAALWLALWLWLLASTLLKIPTDPIDGLLGECLMSLALVAISLSSLQTPANSPSASDCIIDITLHIFYLVDLVLSPGGGLLYRAISLIILLGVLLFDNLQIPTAIAQALFSFWQVFMPLLSYPPPPEYYYYHPNMTKQAPYLEQPHHHMRIGNATIVTYYGLGPSSILLYGLTYIQAMLYLLACIAAQYSIALCNVVDLRSGLRGQRGVGAINLYYKQAYTARMQGGLLAPGNNISLARFAINSVSSNSLDLQLAGVYVLDCFLRQRISSEEELISVISRDSTAVSTLISMLARPSVQEQDTYIRLLAARITAELADSLRIIASTPNMVKSVSSMLDEATNRPALQDSFAIIHGSENENNNRSGDIGSVITRNESPPGQESSAQPSSGNGQNNNNAGDQPTRGEGRWWLVSWFPLFDAFYQWTIIQDTWKILEEQELPLTSQNSFPILALLGMKILESLADDLDRCVEIGRAPGLISKIIGFISWTTVTGNSGDVDNGLQKDMVCLSLNLLRKLGNTGEEIGVELRQHLWNNPFLLHRLAGILEDTSIGPQVREPAMDIIAKLAWDQEARKEIGSTQVIIGKLMQAFLEEGYPQQLRMAAGEALANLTIQIPANCWAILKEPRYDIIKDLQDMLSDTNYRLVAANLLQNLCTHCTQDLLGPSSRDHLSSALKTVMDTIKSTEGKHLEVLIGLASQICNVQGIQLDIHDREVIADKMVGALKGNMIPNPEYPRMRRVTIEMAISITKLCSSYATILREKGMIDLLSKIERLPPSKVEKYRIFFGNVGVVSESDVPLPDLVANAKHLIDPAPGPQPGGHA